jgi:hypothetical protein
MNVDEGELIPRGILVLGMPSGLLVSRMAEITW